MWGHDVTITQFQFLVKNNIWIFDHPQINFDIRSIFNLWALILNLVRDDITIWHLITSKLVSYISLILTKFLVFHSGFCRSVYVILNSLTAQFLTLSKTFFLWYICFLTFNLKTTPNLLPIFNFSVSKTIHLLFNDSYLIHQHGKGNKIFFRFHTIK
jgi:hypothetical protein